MRRRFSQARGYFILESEEFERRCIRRLREDLGVNPEGVEVILRMRAQIVELQDRVRQLETELNVRQAGRNDRLGRIREIYYEASWLEAGPDEG